MSIVKERKSRLRLFRRAAVVLLALAAFGYADVEGDGHEYALMIEALSSHLTPEVRVSDAVRISQVAQANPSTVYRYGIFNGVAKTIEESKPEWSWILRSPSGAYYGLHFWFYPALCVPAKWVLRLVGANELRAAQFTNALIAIGVCAYLFFFSGLAGALPRYLFGLYLFTGTAWYLAWCTPEVFIGSALFLGCVTMAERRPRASAAFLALGSLQNPVLLLLLPVTFLSVARELFEKRQWRRAAEIVAIGSLGLLPFVFCYLKFGKPSLIAGYGFVDSSLIDLQRWLSLLFDLNQGMIIGALPVMIASVAAALAVASGWRAALPLLAALIVSVGLLVQTNWNAGQSVFLRYAYWSAMPLAAGVGLRLYGAKSTLPLLRVVLAAQLLVSLAAFHAGHPLGGAYTQLKPWARWLMVQAPWLIHPEPEIFVERLLDYEITASAFEEPAVLKDDRGTIRKVAIRAAVLPLVHERVCGQGLKLHAVHELDPPRLVTESDFRLAGRYDWRWLNGKYRCYIPM